jgi:peptidoglycan/LPS O-acetylase OafA/YrhL
MKRIELLDYGRFVAAGCVLAFHYLFNGIHNGKISSITHIPEMINYAKYGYLGVEFFFMASGYVIFFSAKNKTAKEFAMSRAVRLYPAFWVAVIFTSIVAQFWCGPQMSVHFFQVIANMTMVPNLLGYGSVDGVYWTLQVELSFYLAVFFFLMTGLQGKLEWLFLLWPVAMLLALMAGKQHLPYAGGYYYYFAAGSVLAIQKSHLSKRSIIPLLVCMYLCIMFSSGKASQFSASNGLAYSPIVIGLIVFAQFIFFFLLNSKLVSNLRIPGSRLAGDLTYPIYLIHAHFGYMLISQFATNKNRLMFYAITVLLVLALSYCIHKFIEQKCAKTWYSLFYHTLGSFVDVLNHLSLGLTKAYNSSINRVL